MKYKAFFIRIFFKKGKKFNKIQNSNKHELQLDNDFNKIAFKLKFFSEK
jgi:hypothetical protein